MNKKQVTQMNTDNFRNFGVIIPQEAEIHHRGTEKN